MYNTLVVMSSNQKQKGRLCAIMFFALVFTTFSLLLPQTQFEVAKSFHQVRAYEESLVVISGIRVGKVEDPAALLFMKAVAEFSLSKPCVLKTCTQLDDLFDCPTRYRVLAWLMQEEAKRWKPQDLGTIARKMHVVERRLGLGRGGNKTRGIQRQIIEDLDKMIQEVEGKLGGKGDGQEDVSKGDGPGLPQRDSYGGTDKGQGIVNRKKFDKDLKGWGKLPEKDRAAALQELSRSLPEKYQHVTTEYFKLMAKYKENNK